MRNRAAKNRSALVAELIRYPSRGGKILQNLARLFGGWWNAGGARNGRSRRRAVCGVGARGIVQGRLTGRLAELRQRQLLFQLAHAGSEMIALDDRLFALST